MQPFCHSYLSSLHHTFNLESSQSPKLYRDNSHRLRINIAPVGFFFLLHSEEHLYPINSYAIIFIQLTSLVRIHSGPLRSSMFSHLVTAAKGLLTRHDPDDPTKHTTTTDNEPKMVTTRRGNKASEAGTNGTPPANGKMNTGKKDGQSNKRRRSETEVSEDAQGESEVEGSDSKQEHTAPEKKGHIKFGSEEPELPEEIPTEQAPADNQEDDESSDDDAPEAIDNSAQLSKIKSETQKQERIKQRSVDFFPHFLFILI